ncbi:hypothetical protein [Paenibacillus sp. SYP-B3998]|uniref:hypothetical protein n=1 Tax=Paenibacillus sp. SYP-B3998 TaxID=2678564 RepID=UPI001F07AB10|nr:hypothetical protein [Paenibacillus sp. SYP-B3998]
MKSKEKKDKASYYLEKLGISDLKYKNVKLIVSLVAVFLENGKRSIILMIKQTALTISGLQPSEYLLYRHLS